LLLRGLWLWPLALYGLAVIVQTLVLRGPSGRPQLWVAPLILLTHLLYGAGFWRGLFTRVVKPSAERVSGIILENIPV
jgi:hypothetical protein